MKLFIGVLAVFLTGGGVCSAEQGFPNSVQNNETTVAPALSPDPGGADDQSDLSEDTYIEPIDVCTISKDEFFIYSFEELIDLESPGAGFDGSETIYCDVVDGGYDPTLMEAYQAADTNEDGDLELVEFESWKENNG
jgi:hypothetical protein